MITAEKKAAQIKAKFIYEMELEQALTKALKYTLEIADEMQSLEQFELVEFYGNVYHLIKAEYLQVKNS